MLVFGCAWKINFPENIFSWPCKMSLWPWKWFEVKIFTSNHFRVRCAKREIDREKEERSAHLNLSSLTHRAHSHASHSRRAQPLDPLPHGSSITELHPLFVDRSTASIAPDRTAPIKRRSHQSRRSQHRADHTGLVDCGTGPIAPRRSSTDCTGLVDRSTTSIKQRSHRIWWIFWPDLTNFFLGFVSFVFVDWEMILYICLEAEKKWATSRKCTLYSIFKNTTKH